MVRHVLLWRDVCYRENNYSAAAGNLWADAHVIIMRHINSPTLNCYSFTLCHYKRFPLPFLKFWFLIVECMLSPSRAQVYYPASKANTVLTHPCLRTGCADLHQRGIEVLENYIKVSLLPQSYPPPSNMMQPCYWSTCCIKWWCWGHDQMAWERQDIFGHDPSTTLPTPW